MKILVYLSTFIKYLSHQFYMKKEEIKKSLLRKLFYIGKWGNNHTNIDNLPKGFPKHIRGDVKSLAKDLIKKNILLAKPTSYGLEISLNPSKKQEIENILKS